MNGAKERRLALCVFAALYLSRIFGLLTLIHRADSSLSALNGCAIALTFTPVFALVSVPALLLLRRGEVLAQVGVREDAVRKGALTAYALFFCLQAATDAGLLDRFSGEAMFRAPVHPLLCAALIAAAAFSARAGVRPILRVCPAAAVGLCGVFLLIAAATARWFDPANLPTAEEAFGARLLKNGAFAAFRSPESAALLFLWDKQKKSPLRDLLITDLLIGLTASLLFTLTAGVTGAFGQTQTFEFFALTTLAELGTVERMDDLLCAAWVFCAYLRTALYLSLSAGCLMRAGVRAGTAKCLSPVLCAAAAAFFVWPSPLRESYERLELSAWISLFFTALLPCALLFRDALRNKRRGGTRRERMGL